MKLTRLPHNDQCPNQCEEGKVYNNADNTSNQWVECCDCDYNFIKQAQIQLTLKKYALMEAANGKKDKQAA